MNAKRWFAWVCLALMLVAEIFLFRATHERDKAVADLHDAQQKLTAVQADLDTLKSSSTGQQADEIASLHKQNDALTAKSRALQARVEQLEKETKQNAQHLTTARTALELQQAHLQQLQVEQQAQQERAAIVANTTTCVNNLQLISAAKNQWAVDKEKAATDVPTVQDLMPYFKDGGFPVCPDGGTYNLNSAGTLPTCSIPGHALPAQ